MRKYWKLVGAVLVVAILAGVMVAAVPAVKPDQGGRQLITLMDNVTVPDAEDSVPGEVVPESINVEDCSEFKGFFTWDGPTSGTGTFSVAIIESVDGSDALVSPGVIGEGVLAATGEAGDYKLVFPVTQGPWRYLAARVTNFNETSPQTVSVFLYAVP